MKYFSVGVLFLCAVSFASAHIPFLVEQPTLGDSTVITNPEVSQAFYGVLEGFPHTFEITTEESFDLFVQVLVPDIASSENIVSASIVKVTPGARRVEDIARLSFKDGEWNTFHEPFVNDTYREGPSIDRVMEAGTYKIEVKTATNKHKYVLVVGKQEELGGIGFFETIRRIAGVKVFFEKSQWRIVESPLVYVPLVVLFSLGTLVWYFWRRGVTKRHVDSASTQGTL